MLPETSHALGVALSVRSIRPRKQITPAMSPALPRRFAIAPLEQFDMPQALSGTLGTNRGERSSLDARSERLASFQEIWQSYSTRISEGGRTILAMVGFRMRRGAQISGGGRRCRLP
jgi:hypothetical protein